MLNKEEQSQQKPQFNLTSFFFHIFTFCILNKFRHYTTGRKSIKKEGITWSGFVHLLSVYWVSKHYSWAFFANVCQFGEKTSELIKLNITDLCPEFQS